MAISSAASSGPKPIAYDDFVGLGGEQAAKEAGKMRAEGKTYQVRDGDVLHFLFNA